MGRKKKHAFLALSSDEEIKHVQIRICPRCPRYSVTDRA